MYKKFYNSSKNVIPQFTIKNADALFDKNLFICIKIILAFYCFMFAYATAPAQSRYFFAPESKWDIHYYTGPYTKTDLIPIVVNQKTDYMNSSIHVLGIKRNLLYRARIFDLEFEANAGKHTGIMNHWELNGFYAIRVRNLFYMPLSLAVGDGLSLASEVPSLENQKYGIDLKNLKFHQDSIESRRLLNYMMVELEAGKETSSWPRVFLRVHHRSGVFGLYCPPDPPCGSNFVTLGIRMPVWVP